MATEKKKPETAKAAKAETKSAKLFPLDELRVKHQTGRAVFAGACAVNGWKPGKVMSDEEYIAGVAKFTEGPTNGPKS